LFKDEGVAPDYDELKQYRSDNEYLHYMHYRLGWTNTYLGRLISAVWVANILLAALVGLLYFGR
jgi:hypothetical protein